MHEKSESLSCVHFCVCYSIILWLGQDNKQSEQADSILSSILEASIWQIGLKRKQVDSKSTELKAKRAKKVKEVATKVD